MHFEDRDQTTLLYLSNGSQAVRLPKTVNRTAVRQILESQAPASSHSRRRSAIAALQAAGIPMIRTTYYAVCNADGPISRAIEATSIDEAATIWAAADTGSWCDEPAMDAEDNLGIEGEGMTEQEFGRAIEAAGYHQVRDLSQIVVGQGPATRMAHIVGGWTLWASISTLIEEEDEQ